jgi:hypothetical protein
LTGQIKTAVRARISIEETRWGGTTRGHAWLATVDQVALAEVVISVGIAVKLVLARSGGAGRLRLGLGSEAARVVAGEGRAIARVLAAAVHPWATRRLRRAAARPTRRTCLRNTYGSGAAASGDAARAQIENPQQRDRSLLGQRDLVSPAAAAHRRSAASAAPPPFARQLAAMLRRRTNCVRSVLGHALGQTLSCLCP